MSRLIPDEIRIRGISAAPGICIGKAYLVDTEGVDVVEQYHIAASRIPHEVKRFKTAVKLAKDELASIIENAPEELRQHAHILETHLVLLKDKMLYGQTIEAVETQQINAEWALKTVTDKIRAMFLNITDPYLKERSSDIVHVSERIMRNLVGAAPVNIAEIDKRVILVARDLSPAETSQIQLERIKGFVTDRGGKASHTGIIAQALDIPAVLGLDIATRKIKTDDLLIVDGTSGLVIIHPSEQTLLEFEEKQNQYLQYKAAMGRTSHLEAETTDGVRLAVMGNIELPEEVVSVIDNGGDGIGLYRTEFQYLSRMSFPSELELFDKYKDVVEVMAPRPVTIRTLDINGDKGVGYTAENGEANPALGLRAIRYCLKKPEVFKIQLRAILRAAAHGNVRILFPMISCLDEVLAARRMLDEAAEELAQENIVFNRKLLVGIMIEVPSAVVMADVLAEHVDFFSIGTNDLIQYSLAIDRGNRHVAYLYHPLHPAVIRMIQHVTRVAKEKGIEVYMCGEMAGDPIHVPILMGLGIKDWSMNPHAIPLVKKMIRALSMADSQHFVRDMLKLTTAADIRKLVEQAYGGLLEEKIYSP
jgi:phosphotransferase system enzyme I (PtsI)